MPSELEHTSNAAKALALPGLLCVCPRPSGDTSIVQVGRAAGWMEPRGIARWEHELSFISRAAMTARLGKALHSTLPHEQIAPKKFPKSYRAAEASPFLPLTRSLVADVVKEGVRVYTVGVDRVSAEFFFFAEGRGAPPVRVQCNLVEMLAPALRELGNADIATLQEALIDRLLTFFSGGIVSELAVELANAVPRMARDGTGMDGTDLDAFDLEARALASRSERWASPFNEMVQALAVAVRTGKKDAVVPLYGEARLEEMPALMVQVGDKEVALPAYRRWTVKGSPRDDLRSVKIAVPRPASAPGGELAQALPPPSPRPPVVSSPSPLPPSPEPEHVQTEDASPKPATAKEPAPPEPLHTSHEPATQEVSPSLPPPLRKSRALRAVLALFVLTPAAFLVWTWLQERAPPATTFAAPSPTESSAPPAKTEPATVTAPAESAAEVSDEAARLVPESGPANVAIAPASTADSQSDAGMDTFDGKIDGHAQQDDASSAEP
jgi:hypothetical protein